MVGDIVIEDIDAIEVITRRKIHTGTSLEWEKQKRMDMGGKHLAKMRMYFLVNN